MEPGDPLHDLKSEPVIRLGAQRVLNGEIRLERRAAARDGDGRLGTGLEGKRHRHRRASVAHRVLHQFEERLAKEPAVPRDRERRDLAEDKLATELVGTTAHRIGHFEQETVEVHSPVEGRGGAGLGLCQEEEVVHPSLHLLGGELDAPQHPSARPFGPGELEGGLAHHQCEGSADLMGRFAQEFAILRLGSFEPIQEGVELLADTVDLVGGRVDRQAGAERSGGDAGDGVAQFVDRGERAAGEDIPAAQAKEEDQEGARAQPPPNSPRR